MLEADQIIDLFIQLEAAQDKLIDNLNRQIANKGDGYVPGRVMRGWVDDAREIQSQIESIETQLANTLHLKQNNT